MMWFNFRTNEYWFSDKFRYSFPLTILNTLNLSKAILLSWKFLINKFFITLFKVLINFLILWFLNLPDGNFLIIKFMRINTFKTILKIIPFLSLNFISNPSMKFLTAFKQKHLFLTFFINYIIITVLWPSIRIYCCSSYDLY